MPITSPQTRATEIASYAAQLDAAYPPGPDSAGNLVDFGADYQIYMANHPAANPELVYETVLARLSLLQAVPGAIGHAVGAGAGAVGGVTQATSKAIPSIYPVWLQGFLGANGVMRIIEGLLGLLVAAVALDKLLDGNAGPATQIAKVL